MAGVDKIDLTILIASIDSLLNNGVADDSITPNAHNTVLEDTLTSLAFFSQPKYVIIPAGVPSSGEISLDGDNFLTVAKMHVHKVNNHSVDISLAIANISGGSVIHLKQYDGTFGEFTVSAVTEELTYFTLDVIANTSNNPTVPTSLQGFLSAYSKGGSANIMNSSLGMTANQTQDFGGFIQTFFKGVIKLDGVKIVIAALEVTVISLGVLEIDLISQVDARTVEVDNDFTINFVNMQIGTGFINLNIVSGGNHSLTSGTNVVWKDQTAQEVSQVSGQFDRLYWTCDGINVTCSIEHNRG